MTPNQHNPQMELPSNRLSAELATRRIQASVLEEQLASVREQIGTLRTQIATAKDTEQALGMVLAQGQQPSAVAQQAAQAPAGIESPWGYAARKEMETGKPYQETLRGLRGEVASEVKAEPAQAAAAPKPQPKPSPTPSPKPKPKRKRGGPPTYTAAGKRRGRPPGSKNRDKPAVQIATAQQAAEAADHVDREVAAMTPQQRANLETVRAARAQQAAVN